jgi:hypothetical protein
VKLDDCHSLSVLRADSETGEAEILRRRARSDDEGNQPMLKRWRERRKLTELARLWAALDAAAR